MVNLIQFIGVLAILAIGAELLARGTEGLEKRFGQGIAGGIVLGFLTTLPETIITLEALNGGEYEVAVGSAIGGNVILFTLGIGLVGLIYSFSWKRSLVMNYDYKVENNFLIINTVILVLIIFYGKFDLLTAITLSSIYFIYVLYRIRKGRGEGEENDKSESLIKNVVELIVGTALMLSFSDLFVKCIVVISRELNLPEAWISLVITPVASELEEKMSGIRLAMRNVNGGSLAVVSFVGSKIENSTLLLGLIGFFTSYDFHNTLPELISAIVANVIGIVILLDGKITKYESLFLIALYFAIIYLTFIL